MCGIVGYTGPREAYPIVIKGLKRLELLFDIMIENKNNFKHFVKNKGSIRCFKIQRIFKFNNWQYAYNCCIIDAGGFIGLSNV